MCFAFVGIESSTNSTLPKATIFYSAWSSPSSVLSSRLYCALCRSHAKLPRRSPSLLAAFSVIPQGTASVLPVRLRQRSPRFALRSIDTRFSIALERLGSDAPGGITLCGAAGGCWAVFSLVLHLAGPAPPVPFPSVAAFQRDPLKPAGVCIPSPAVPASPREV